MTSDLKFTLKCIIKNFISTWLNFHLKTKYRLRLLQRWLLSMTMTGIAFERKLYGARSMAVVCGLGSPNRANNDSCKVCIIFIGDLSFIFVISVV